MRRRWLTQTTRRSRTNSGTARFVPPSLSANHARTWAGQGPVPLCGFPEDEHRQTGSLSILLPRACDELHAFIATSASIASAWSICLRRWPFARRPPQNKMASTMLHVGTFQEHQLHSAILKGSHPPRRARSWSRHLLRQQLHQAVLEGRICRPISAAADEVLLTHSEVSNEAQRLYL
jgi:hypothetical protein